MNKSQQLQHQRMKRRELSELSGKGGGGQNNRDKHGCQFHRLFINTGNVVHSNWVLSVCWDCPFIPLTAVVYKNTKVTFVFLLVSVNSRVAWFSWMKRGRIFFTLYRSIYYFLVASETKRLLYRILGVGDDKKKIKKKQESETKKKKSSGPEHDDADSAALPPSC